MRNDLDNLDNLDTYLRLDDRGSIVAVVVDTLMPILDTDILIPDFSKRRKELFGEEYPSLFTNDNRPIYKYVDGKVLKWDKPSPPIPEPLDNVTLSLLVLAEMLEISNSSPVRDVPFMSLSDSPEQTGTWAISTMYARLIERPQPLRTLEQVPEQYRAEVEQLIGGESV